MANLDDECGICGSTRDYHGDANHEFNVDGVLIKKKAPEPPRQNPPRTRDEAAVAVDMEHKLVLRLIEVLIDKGILDAKDLLRIIGGEYVSNQEDTKET